MEQETVDWNIMINMNASRGWIYVSEFESGSQETERDILAEGSVSADDFEEEGQSERTETD